MRDIGIPKLLAWRWTPFAALVLGSLSFVGFVTLAVPDTIGGALEGASTSSLRLGNHLGRAQPPHPTTADGTSDLSTSDESSLGSSSPAPPSPGTQVATLSPQSYPKRGFSPPLERPDPPPPPPPPVAVAPPPVAEPPQPVLNVPPPQEAPPPPPQPVAVSPDGTAPSPDAPQPPPN
jgi:hypothetical protein